MIRFFYFLVIVVGRDEWNAVFALQLRRQIRHCVSPPREFGMAVDLYTHGFSVDIDIYNLA